MYAKHYSVKFSIVTKVMWIAALGLGSVASFPKFENADYLFLDNDIGDEMISHSSNKYNTDDKNTDDKNCNTETNEFRKNLENTVLSAFECMKIFHDNQEIANNKIEETSEYSYLYDEKINIQAQSCLQYARKNSKLPFEISPCVENVS